MNLPPLPTFAKFQAMPWPARDRLALAYKMTRLRLENYIRDRETAALAADAAKQSRARAELVEQILTRCTGCGMTRHVGYTCRTCAILERYQGQS